MVTVTGTGHGADPLDLLWLAAAAAIAAGAHAPPSPQLTDIADVTDPAGVTGRGGEDDDPTAAAIRAGWRAIALLDPAQLAALTVVLTRFATPLPTAAGALAGVCILAALARTVRTIREFAALPAARREARTDTLTGLANRRRLDEDCARLLTDPAAAPVTASLAHREPSARAPPPNR